MHGKDFFVYLNVFGTAFYSKKTQGSTTLHWGLITMNLNSFREIQADNITDSSNETTHISITSEDSLYKLTINTSEQKLHDLEEQIQKLHKNGQKLLAQHTFFNPGLHSKSQTPSKAPDAEHFQSAPLLKQYDTALKESYRSNELLKKDLLQKNCILEQKTKHFNETMLEFKMQNYNMNANIYDRYQDKTKETVFHEVGINSSHSPILGNLVYNSKLNKDVTQCQKNEKTLSEKLEQHEACMAKLCKNISETLNLYESIGYESLPSQNTDAISRLSECVAYILQQYIAKKNENEQLKTSMSVIEKCYKDKETILFQQHQQQINECIKEKDHQLDLMKQRADKAVQQSENLQQQLTSLQEKNEEMMVRHQYEVDELKRQKSEIMTEFGHTKELWITQREAMVHTASEKEKEIVSIKEKQDVAVLTETQLRTYIKALQSEIEDHKSESRTYKCQLEAQMKTSSSLQTNLDEKDKLIASKNDEICELKSNVSNVTTQLTDEFNCKFREFDEQQQSTNITEIAELNKKITDITNENSTYRDQLNQTETELKVAQHHIRSIEETKVLLTEEIESLKIKCRELEIYNEDIKVEKERLMKFELEANNAKLQNVCRHCSQKTPQNRDSCSDKMDDMMRENEKLKELMNEKDLKLVTMKESLDSSVKKLKTSQKQIKDLEVERKKMHDEITKFTREMEIAQHDYKTRLEREAFLEEKAKIAENERAKCQTELISISKDCEQQTVTLNNNNQALKNELSLAKRTVANKERLESKALKLANRLQNELANKRSQIDTLQTQSRWMAERMTSLAKNMESKYKDGERCKQISQQLFQEKTKLSIECQKSSQQNHSLKLTIDSLEKNLEKTAANKINVKQEVEQLGQHLATALLYQQLAFQEKQQCVSSDCLVGQNVPYCMACHSAAYSNQHASALSNTQSTTKLPSNQTLPQKCDNVTDVPLKIEPSLKTILDDIRSLLPATTYNLQDMSSNKNCMS